MNEWNRKNSTLLWEKRDDNPRCRSHSAPRSRPDRASCTVSFIFDSANPSCNAAGLSVKVGIGIEEIVTQCNQLAV